MPEDSDIRADLPTGDRNPSGDQNPAGDPMGIRATGLPDVPGLVRDRLDRWRADVRANRFEPVVRTLMQAADAVERFDGVLPAHEAGSDDRGTRNPSELLASLADEVLDPIRETLDQTDLLSGLPLSLLETLHELRSRSAQMSEAVPVPVDPSLYDPVETDSALTHVRKALVRGRRKFPGGSTKLQFRDVQLRRIALFHVIERIGSFEIESTLARRRQIAASLARLERSLSDLTHTILGRVSAGEPVDDHPPDPDDSIQRAHESILDLVAQLDSLPAAPILRDAWQNDVSASGTFMAESRSLGDESIRRRLALLTHHAEDWAAWQTQLTDRLAYCVRLIAVRYELAASSRSVRSDLADALSVPVEALDTVARTIRESESDVPMEALSRQTLEASAWLAETESHLIEVLDHTIVEAIPKDKLTTDVSSALSSLREDMSRIRDRYGDTFSLHPLASPDTSSVDPRIDTSETDLKEILRQGFEPVAQDAFGSRVNDAAASLVDVLQRAPELREVIRYNLRAADSTTGEHGEDDVLPADVVEAGLSRAAEAADQMAAGMRGHAQSIDRVLMEGVEQAWTRIHERARIQRQVQGAVMDLQREVDVQFRRASETTRSAWKRLTTFARRSSMRGIVLIRRILRRGREAVGAVSDERAGYHETASALSSLDEILDQVPAIYRRLFSFSPLSEPELLVGREQDLAFLKKHVALWENGVPQALILHGNPSSGRTSLLNVLRAEIEDSCEIVRISLPHDLSSQKELLSLLDETSGFKTRKARSLNELGDRILADDRPEGARICIVEQLGSLMTRTIGGFDFIADFISFMSRTDSRWLWIATMSESGWKALSSARPEAASLTISRTLQPIERVGLERLVMQRHQRSGVPLEFLEPPDPSPLLRRRLRTALQKAHRQAVLREAWFDRLFALTGQDIMMALFYWLRSVEMTEAEDRLLVRWFSPIRFDFLSAFSMDQAFALKAILERGALTVAQHAETNLVSMVESRRILESLGNAMLIEPVGDKSSTSRFDFTSIRDDRAYRIRPLVVHPVLRFLRERNIVH